MFYIQEKKKRCISWGAFFMDTFLYNMENYYIADVIFYDL